MGKEYLHNPVFIRCFNYDEMSESCANCPCNDFDASLSVLCQEIDAFYYVFNNLEKNWRHSGITISKEHNETPILLYIPYITNGAFACELALKYILIDSKIPFKTGKGHDLKYLFDLLPDIHRNELMNQLVMNNEFDSEKIYEELSSIATSFVDRRYIFSNITEPHRQTKFFGTFVHTVCQYVLGDPSDQCLCNCCASQKEPIETF